MDLPNTTHERIKLVETNPYLTCHLCKGYFIDATTISECLHSFCRSCIIKFLQENSHCPICEVIINKAKPNIKLDKTLQDIVYKLVPELFINEMTRRQRFYQNHPELAARVTPEERGVDTERTIFNPKDSISLSIEYISDDSTPGAIVVPLATEISKNSKNSSCDSESQIKRFLQCPGMCRIEVLKKFVQNKYNVDTSSFHIDILYKRVPLPNHYTLIDIAYIYSWKRNEPMKFFFRITDKALLPERFDYIGATHQPDIFAKPTRPVRANGDRSRSKRKSGNSKSKCAVAKLVKDKIRSKPESKEPESASAIENEKNDVIINTDKIKDEIKSKLQNNIDNKNPVYTNITLNRNSNLEIITKVQKVSNKNGQPIGLNIIKQTVKKARLPALNNGSESQKLADTVNGFNQNLKTQTLSDSNANLPKTLKNIQEEKGYSERKYPEKQLKDILNSSDRNDIGDDPIPNENVNIAQNHTQTNKIQNRSNKSRAAVRKRSPSRSKNKVVGKKSFESNMENSSKKCGTKDKTGEQNSLKSGGEDKSRVIPHSKVIDPPSKVIDQVIECKEEEGETNPMDVDEEKSKFLKSIELTAKSSLQTVDQHKPEVQMQVAPPKASQKRKSFSPIKNERIAKKSRLDKKVKSNQAKGIQNPTVQQMLNNVNNSGRNISMLVEQTGRKNSANDLQYLFDSCKINIPSSLSITLKESSEDDRGRHAPTLNPVQNYIEILKLPDVATEENRIEQKLENLSNHGLSVHEMTEEATYPERSSASTDASTLPSRSGITILSSHLIKPPRSVVATKPDATTAPPKVSPSNVPCKIVMPSKESIGKLNPRSAQSFQKMFEEAIKTPEFSNRFQPFIYDKPGIKGPRNLMDVTDSNAPTSASKRNILEIASQLYKRTKLEWEKNSGQSDDNAANKTPIGKVRIPRLNTQKNLKPLKSKSATELTKTKQETTVAKNLSPDSQSRFQQTFANLHSASLGLNYTVSVSQNSPNFTNAAIPQKAVTSKIGTEELQMSQDISSQKSQVFDDVLSIPATNNVSDFSSVQSTELRTLNAEKSCTENGVTNMNGHEISCEAKADTTIPQNGTEKSNHSVHRIVSASESNRSVNIQGSSDGIEVIADSPNIKNKTVSSTKAQNVNNIGTLHAVNTCRQRYSTTEKNHLPAKSSKKQPIQNSSQPSASVLQNTEFLQKLPFAIQNSLLALQNSQAQNGLQNAQSQDNSFLNPNLPIALQNALISAIDSTSNASPKTKTSSPKPISSPRLGVPPSPVSLSPRPNSSLRLNISPTVSPRSSISPKPNLSPRSNHSSISPRPNHSPRTNMSPMSSPRGSKSLSTQHSPKENNSQSKYSSSTSSQMNANQLLEKYNIQNLAQLTASFNFNPAAFGLGTSSQLAALQQAMILKHFEMQNRQNWLNMNQHSLMQYEKYLQSLNQSHSNNHLLSKEN